VSRGHLVHMKLKELGQCQEEVIHSPTIPKCLLLPRAWSVLHLYIEHKRCTKRVTRSRRTLKFILSHVDSDGRICFCKIKGVTWGFIVATLVTITSEVVDHVVRRWC
jgi:hypothetical protein